MKGTAGFFEQIGLRPGRVHATAAGFNEFAGGALLALGLLTPLAATLLIATMTAAIITVHGPKGPWASDGGYEYNLVLATVAFALTAVGSGTLSLDHALGLNVAGIGWALGALALGVIGGIGAVASGRLQTRHTAGTEAPVAT